MVHVTTEPTIWGIHAGRTGEARSLFLEKKVVALGWNEMGDLSTLPQDREAYKARLRERFPTAKEGAIPVWAGQLYRFVFEVKEGDYVVYPSKIDRRINIGRITGPYHYVDSPGNDYAQRRTVDWLKAIPRTSFTQGALYEIGSALSIFLVKNYADEFIAVLEGREIATSADADETVALVAEEIEATTHDFIIKQLSRELKGHPFARFVADLLEAMGYRTRVSPPGPDRGVDIIAHRDLLGIEPPIIKVEVKSGAGSIGEPAVARLFGTVAGDEFGLFVTLSDFTHQAHQFAESKSSLRLIDGDEIVRLTLEHYDKLDSRYKGLIPLKRVYIPEGIDEAGE
jgi:restriction system protein